MTITPYTTPLQYEYKPLNLMAFAEPLSKMQEQFDIVKASIDESDFDITNLPFGTDPERAKALLKIVEGKRDELAQSLAETKNYKQAASKLKELNTVWQEDPEVLALKSNYDKYAADVQLAKDNVKANIWGQTYADQWLNRAKREYQGANFTADETNPEGDYQVFGRNPRVKDIQKDFDELAYKVAAAVPGTTREGALQEAGIDVSLMSKKFLQEIVEEKDANIVAQKVSAYLKTLPQYEEYFREKADYDFADIKADPDLYKATAVSLNNEYIKNLDAEISQIKAAAKKDKSLLTNPDYLDLLEEREVAVNSKNTGEYDETGIKNLYQNAYLADAYDMTALGKVFAYKNVKRNYSWQDLYIPPVSTGNGVTGDGTDWTGLGGGFWKEAGEETLDYSTLKDLRNKSAASLSPIVQNIGKLAGSAVARITIGTAGSDLYKKTKYDQSLIWNNQQKLLNVITQSGGNANTIIAKAKEVGLTVSAADAKRLVTAFGKSGEAIGDYQTLLEQGRSYKNSMTSAGTAVDNMIKNSAAGTGMFAMGLAGLGDSPVFPGAAPNPVSYQIGTPGVGVSFGLESYAFKGAADKEVAKKTWNQLAKERGYDNLQQAVAAGEYFEDVAPGGIKAAFAALGPSKDATIMTYEYIDGSKKVNNYVASMFSTPDDLLNLDPAYYSGWSDVPGFREGDTDVKIDISGNTQPRLVKAGDQILYEVPITYKEGEILKSGRVTVVPSAALGLQNQKVLRNMDIMSSSDDAADIQTNSTIKSARYDRVYEGNALNDYTLKNTSITKGGTPVTLDIIPYDASTSIIVEKTYDANSYGPKLKVKAVNTTTGESQYLTDASGKIWYTDASSVGAADAAKAFVMSVIDPVTP
jgi:hypothetical protein